MKLTESILKDLIKEEIEASLEEQEMIGTLTPIVEPNPNYKDSRRRGGKKRVPGDVGQYEPAVPAFDPELAKDRAPEMAKIFLRRGKEGYEDYNNPRIQREEAHLQAIKAYSRLQKLKDNPFANPAEIKKAEKEYKRLSKIHRNTPYRKSPGFPVAPGIGMPEKRSSVLPDLMALTQGDMPEEQDGIPAAAPRDSLPKLKKIKESTLRTIIREVLEGMV